jgi:hypothetical protein
MSSPIAAIETAVRRRTMVPPGRRTNLAKLTW